MPITALPTDVLGLILAHLAYLGRKRAICRVKPTCRAFRNAAVAAEQAVRRVCYEGHTETVFCVAAAHDGRGQPDERGPQAVARRAVGGGGRARERRRHAPRHPQPQPPRRRALRAREAVVVEELTS